MNAIRYFVLSILPAVSFATNSWGEIAESAVSWKYLVERTTTVHNKLADKKDIHVERAFVHYGAGARQARGQIKEVPQVVYVDSNLKRVAKAAYYESPIVPSDRQKFGLSASFPENRGSDPNSPLPAHGLPRAFEIFPLKPEAELRKALSWSYTWYMFYGETPEDYAFSIAIKHEMTHYELKKGRRCAVIEYKIDGTFDLADYPERFSEEVLRKAKERITLKGNGTAHYDPAEGIIVEKEQTMSWMYHSQRYNWIAEEKAGWTTTRNKEEIFTTKVSLQPPESGPKADFSKVPGVVIVHSPAGSGKYVGSPSIAILPNGDYVASHDFFGRGGKRGRWKESGIYRSSDQGRSWKHICTLTGPPAWWSNLFWHNGALYLCGCDGKLGNGVIRRSDDYGHTWSTPSDANTGLLLPGSYHTAPVPMVIRNGRIWRAMEQGERHHVFIMSAPVDADLLRRSNWTFSNRVQYSNSYRTSLKSWREANAVVTPEGKMAMVMRVAINRVHSTAAWFDVSDDGRQVTFDPATGFITMPGATGKKFTIRYDKTSRRYWALVNPILTPDLKHMADHRANELRNCLAVASSPDLKNWTVHKVVAYHPDNHRHAFQYPDFVFEGSDMLIVARTAYDDGLGGAPNYHDANFMTFHRVENFRDLINLNVYGEN